MKDNADGVDKVHLQKDDDPYAFFMESMSILYETERKCNLTKTGPELDDKNYGIGMRKGMSLQDQNKKNRMK